MTVDKNGVEHSDARLSQAVADVLTHCHSGLCENGYHFTCDEADMIAELYRAWGDDTRADQFLYAHSVDDDEGDSHYALRKELGC